MFCYQFGKIRSIGLNPFTEKIDRAYLSRGAAFVSFFGWRWSAWPFNSASTTGASQGLACLMGNTGGKGERAVWPPGWLEIPENPRRIARDAILAISTMAPDGTG